MAVTPRDFARRLRQLREQAGWTQEKLAERADLSRNYIGLLESSRREPSLSTLLAISRALSSSLDELVGMARVAEAPAVYRRFSRVLEAMEKCSPSENDLIADIVDNCVRLTRKTR